MAIITHDVLMMMIDPKWLCSMFNVDSVDNVDPTTFTRHSTIQQTYTTHVDDPTMTMNVNDDIIENLSTGNQE